jgi:hypothetical protein
MKIQKLTAMFMAAAAATFSAGSLASADDVSDVVETYGLALSVGGGVEDFSGEEMRDNTSIAGMWDARALIGSKSYLAFEAAYVGSASTIDAQFGGDSATLIGTTVEALIRGNLLPNGPVQPYAFVGGAWRRYNVAEADFSTSDAGISDSDDLLMIPVGAGVGYRYEGFVADARFTFRFASDNELLLEDGASTGSDDYATMHAWSAGARVGYEF